MSWPRPDFGRLILLVALGLHHPHRSALAGFRESQVGQKCGERTLPQLLRTSHVEQNVRSPVLIGGANSDSLEPSDSYGGPSFAVDDAATASLRCSNADRLKRQARNSASRGASPAQGVRPKRLALRTTTSSPSSSQGPTPPRVPHRGGLSPTCSI